MAKVREKRMKNRSTQIKVPEIPLRDAARCGVCGEIVTDTAWFLTYYVKKVSGRFKVVDLHLNHTGTVKEPSCRFSEDEYITAKRRGWDIPPVSTCSFDPCIEADLEALAETLEWSRNAKKTLYEMMQHLRQNRLYAIPQAIDLIKLENWKLENISAWLKGVADYDKYFNKIVIERGLTPLLNVLELSKPNCRLKDRFLLDCDYIPTALFRVALSRGAKFILNVLKDETELKNFIQDLYLQKLTITADEFLETQDNAANLQSRAPTKV